MHSDPKYLSEKEEEKQNKLIGFYNYSVVLTYISLLISVFGMTQAIGGKYKTAIVCLALSGLCDMFDGKVARSMKGRTRSMKSFGIQIDSLCDVVCFGAFPALICFLLGVRGPVGLLVIGIYCVNSVIRLAYYNVLEMDSLYDDIEIPPEEKYYHGLPITSMAIVLPITFLFQFFVSAEVFIIILHLVLLIVGMLFVVDFPVKKPNITAQAVMVTVVTTAIIIMLVYVKYRVHNR